jgi:predicted ATPase
MIKQVIISNYKSIKHLELPLHKLNVLIGSNGVGKSNLISFFELAKAIIEQRFGSYTLDKGGIDNLLYRSRKESNQIQGLLNFDNTNAFFFELRPAQSNKGYIEQSGDYYNNLNIEGTEYNKWNKTKWDSAVEESCILYNPLWRAGHIRRHFKSFTVYHFHDTSSRSPMRGECDINDNEFLRDNGANLAAYLYRLQQTDEKSFKLIEGVVRSIAPYFKQFKLRPNPTNLNKISLEWEEINTDMYLNGYSFSDGTLRFIALATLLLQSNAPKVIIIDEPELGLHPAAINKFAEMIKKVSFKSQIILSTQSTNLVNCFEPEDIVVVDRKDDQSSFERLRKDELAVWLDEYEYSLSDVWEKNIIGGQL